RRAGSKLGKLNLTASSAHIKAALVQLKAATAKRPIAKPTIVARRSGRESKQSVVATKKASRGNPEPDLGALLAGSLLQAWEVLNERLGQSQKQPTAKTIHAVRIAGKKLRYLIEVMRALR